MLAILLSIWWLVVAGSVGFINSIGLIIGYAINACIIIWWKSSVQNFVEELKKGEVYQEGK